MIFHFTATFKKQFKKLTPKLQEQFEDRLQIFIDDPTSPTLRNHPLKGEYVGYWSINISGDFRAIYYKEGDEIIIFALIGTHSSLYK